MKITKRYHCLISSSGWVAHCVLLQKQHQNLRVEQEGLSRISLEYLNKYMWYTNNHSENSV